MDRLLRFYGQSLSMKVWLFLFYQFVASLCSNGGWETLVHLEPEVFKGPCNIQKHDAQSLTVEEFRERYSSEPFIITIVDSSDFRELCTKERLLAKYAHRSVLLTSTKTKPYAEQNVVLFSEYIETYLDRELTGRADEMDYLFGDINNVGEWSELLKHYNQPKWTLPGRITRNSDLYFGIAGAGTGVVLHAHGPVFAEVIYGKKRWFLYSPEEKIHYYLDTSYDWVLKEYPHLKNKPLECVLKPGEILFIPDRWYHATLNLETSVFMSMFLNPESYS